MLFHSRTSQRCRFRITTTIFLPLTQQNASLKDAGSVKLHRQEPHVLVRISQSPLGKQREIPASSMASTSEARSSFNLKVLRRHDPSIVEIFETASFVVLYNYNNGEWTKTGVEGPLFLFRRRLPPYNGFFLMNRNGIENFSADVTPDDDLEITPEFIIYRPETSGDNEVYGIWVFEPSQRMAVGDKLLKLQQMVEAPSEEQVRVADAASSSTVADAKQAAAGGAAQKTGKEPEAKGGKSKANGKRRGTQSRRQRRWRRTLRTRRALEALQYRQQTARLARRSTLMICSAAVHRHQRH